MNIWVPYTTEKLRPETRAALNVFDPHYAWMDGDANYPHLLKDLWSLKQTVIIVEHDVVPEQAQILDLWACDHQWCAFSYGEDFKECTTTLGCCLFTPTFMRATEGVWEAMIDNALDRERNPNGLDIRGNPKWKLCDGWLTAWARARGIEVHQHWPAAKHLH